MAVPRSHTQLNEIGLKRLKNVLTRTELYLSEPKSGFCRGIKIGIWVLGVKLAKMTGPDWPHVGTVKPLCEQGESHRLTKCKKHHLG